MVTLLGEWGFLDNLNDTSGNGRNGSANFTPLYVDGPLTGMRALQFNSGATDTITLGNEGLSPLLDGVSYMGWIWIPAGTISTGIGFHTGLPIRSRTGGDSTRAGISFNDEDRFRTLFRWKNDLQFDDTGPRLSRGSWHHLCVVDGNTKKAAYLDGVQTLLFARSGMDNSTTPTWEEWPWVIGAYNGLTNSFPGVRVSGIRIFQGELSGAEVLTWMNTPIAAPNENDIIQVLQAGVWKDAEVIGVGDAGVLKPVRVVVT